MSDKLEITRAGEVSADVLSQRLQSRLGSRFEGLRIDDGQVEIYTATRLNERDANDVRALIQTHDPTEKTPARAVEDQRRTARRQIEDEDFAALKAAISTSNLDAGTKAALAKIVNLIQSLAIAGGYVNPADVIEPAL